MNEEAQAQEPKEVKVITQEQAVLRALAFMEARLIRIEAKLDSALAANPMISAKDVEEK